MRRLLILPAFAALLATPALGQTAPQGQGPIVITSPVAGGGAARPSGGDAVQALPANPAARMDERLYQLEELVRQLTGKVEEANFKTSQLAKQLERMQADVDLRFKDIEQAKAAAQAQPGEPPAGAPQAGGPAPGPQLLGTMPEKDMKKALAASKPTDPQTAYDEAYALAQKGDYDGAERAFQAFLQQFPKDNLAGNAHYWLGDIDFARKNFNGALKTFAEAIKAYPKHPKAPDMLFKLGASFGQLGMKNEACKSFLLLFEQHPNMPDRVKRAATAEKKAQGCK